MPRRFWSGLASRFSHLAIALAGNRSSGCVAASRRYSANAAPEWFFDSPDRLGWISGVSSARCQILRPVVSRVGLVLSANSDPSGDGERDRSGWRSVLTTEWRRYILSIV